MYRPIRLLARVDQDQHADDRIWDMIEPVHQSGEELGKEVATRIVAELESPSAFALGHCSSTDARIRWSRTATPRDDGRSR
jgi:hypothetical protein